MSLIGDIIVDLNNWVRSWDSTVFAIVIIILVFIGTMFSINIIKALIGGTIKFKFFSFLFLALVLGAMIYICLIR